MFPTTQSSSKLNGILFIVLIGGMFIYSIPSIFKFSETETDNWSLFMDGKLLRKYETFYDKQFFAREPAVKFWADIRYLAFNEGTSGVILGKDAWLFSNQEYLVVNDLSEQLNKQYQQIKEIDEQLNLRGQKLIILPIPMKVDIEHSHISREPESVVINLYDSFIKQLNEANIAAVDIRPSFQQQVTSHSVFIRNDTHWSPEGASLAAKQIALQYPELKQDTLFITNKINEKQHKGDLMNYMQFHLSIARQNYQPVNLPIFETIQANQEISDSALFGDQKYPIALVGTSYTKMDDWNFTGFLKQELQTDILTHALEANGPFEAMAEFLKQPDFNDPTIHTVIWEFPVRTLLVQSFRNNKKGTENQVKHF